MKGRKVGPAEPGELRPELEELEEPAQGAAELEEPVAVLGRERERNRERNREPGAGELETEPSPQNRLC